jgi:hypothetical protein
VRLEFVQRAEVFLQAVWDRRWHRILHVYCSRKWMFCNTFVGEVTLFFSTSWGLSYPELPRGDAPRGLTKSSWQGLENNFPIILTRCFEAQLFVFS